MQIVKLLRNIELPEHGTFGTVSINETPFCVSLELCWKDNQRDISCIPEGMYNVELTFSPHFEKQLYLIKNVQDRDGIRIHSANVDRQLLGCQAYAESFGKIYTSGQEEIAIMNSGKTMQRFMQIMNNEFIIEIRDINHQAIPDFRI